jgi:hypothetical protein
MQWHEREVPVNRWSVTPRPVLFPPPPPPGCRQPGGLPPHQQIIKVTVKEIHFITVLKVATQ